MKNHSPAVSIKTHMPVEKVDFGDWATPMMVCGKRFYVSYPRPGRLVDCKNCLAKMKVADPANEKEKIK